MANPDISRRFERLILAGLGLLAVASALLILATAAKQYGTRYNALCYKALSDSIIASPLVSQAWDLEQRAPALYAGEYERVLRTVLALEEGDICAKIYDEVLADRNPRLAPSEMAAKAKAQSEEIRNSPISSFGIQFPAKVNFALSGPTIQFEMFTLVAVLQVALFPTIGVWLVSFLKTRKVELMELSAQKTGVVLYPHVLNIFPREDRASSIRRFRRVRLLLSAPKIAAWYAVIRATIILTVAVFPVTIYMVSVQVLGLLSNWIAVPIFAFLFLMAFLASLQEFEATGVREKAFA